MVNVNQTYAVLVLDTGPGRASLCALIFRSRVPVPKIVIIETFVYDVNCWLISLQ
jgi:hypothetical protein